MIARLMASRLIIGVESYHLYLREFEVKNLTIGNLGNLWRFVFQGWQGSLDKKCYSLGMLSGQGSRDEAHSRQACCSRN